MDPFTALFIPIGAAWLVFGGMLAYGHDLFNF